MLGGKDLGGCEERGLASGIHDLEHGAQGNDCFAGTHFALQEPVHGRIPAQLLGQGLSDGGLAGGQRERKVPVEGAEEAPGQRSPGCGFLGRKLGAPPRQGSLQDQSFLVSESFLRPLPVLGGLRRVDQPIRLSDAQQTVPPGKMRRDRVLQPVKVHGLQERSDHFVNGPTGQFGCRRVHRNRHGGQLRRVHGAFGFRVLIEQQEVGVGQAKSPTVACHLPRKHGPATGQQLRLGAEPVEETHLQGPRDTASAGLIGDDDICDGTTAGAHLAGAVGQDAGDERDFLVQRQVADGRQLSAAQVTPREVVQQGTG
ncbi:hypothetical protein PJL18_03610 [Paenarthrobacter nicotinovorans]|nr:hypothetical protein [Paenarthrobacter nicotinovorans]